MGSIVGDGDSQGTDEDHAPSSPDLTPPDQAPDGDWNEESKGDVGTIESSIVQSLLTETNATTPLDEISASASTEVLSTGSISGIASPPDLSFANTPKDSGNEDAASVLEIDKYCDYSCTDCKADAV